MSEVAAKIAAPVLPAFYYKDNFVALCETVKAQYSDLLSEAELTWLATFDSQDQAAQALYIRLVCRVGPLFRLDRLAYAEIGDLLLPLQELIEAGLVSDVPVCTLEQMASLYTKAELYRAFGTSLAVTASARKDLLIQSIEAARFKPPEMMDSLRRVVDTQVVAVEQGETLQLFELLFFGNRYQSLTDFVLSDLGIANHYPYALDSHNRLFTCRQGIEEYLEIAVFADEFYELSELGDLQGLIELAARVKALQVQYDSSRRRWGKICVRIGRELERLDELDLAFELYALCDMHPARERSARVLENKQEWRRTVDLCMQIQAAPYCEAELEAAGKIAHRAQRKSGGPAKARERDSFNECRLQIKPTDLGVEADVAHSMQEHWQTVEYVENSLMNTLFGLAFWQEIFAPVPGVFHNPFQGVPADMYEGSFYASRRGQIDARLAQLREQDLQLELGRARDCYEAYQCHWTSWSYVSRQLQDLALAVIPAQHLVSIWERLLFDPKENRNGFPDLVALGEEQGNYCFIEVKGPGDRLQDNQKRWLRYFAANNIPAQVAWVEWIDG